jgi:hypothetical protein
VRTPVTATIASTIAICVTSVIAKALRSLSSDRCLLCGGPAATRFAGGAHCPWQRLAEVPLAHERWFGVLQRDGEPARFAGAWGSGLAI